MLKNHFRVFCFFLCVCCFLLFLFFRENKALHWMCIVSSILTFNTIWANAANDRLMVFYYFCQKRRKFAWNVKACFLEKKIRKIFQNEINRYFYPVWLASILKRQSQLQQTTTFLFFYFFRENMSQHFMWISCLADDSHEMSRLVFSEKKKKKEKKFRMLSATNFAWHLNWTSWRLKENSYILNFK